MSNTQNTVSTGADLAACALHMLQFSSLSIIIHKSELPGKSYKLDTYDERQAESP